MENNLITSYELYWITRLDSISLTATVFMVLSAITTIVGTIGYIVNKSFSIDFDYNKKEYVAYAKGFKRAIQIGLPIFILALISQIFIPTTKQMCAIKIVPLLVNNRDVQNIGQDALNLAHEWMNELLPQSKTKETTSR